MSRKVLVISTSLRKGGNFETLADEFVRGIGGVGTITGHSSLKKAYETGKGTSNEKK